MSSEISKSYWEKLAKSIQDPSETTNKRKKAYLQTDINFVKRHLALDDSILDVGAGSGLVVNALVESVKEIVAVETFKGLSKFIDPKILVINAELTGFQIRKQFDKIVSTGLTHFFPEEDIVKIYANMFDMLKNGGKLIMRSHCGLEDKVVINGYSEELNSKYFTEYRKVDTEKKILAEAGFKDIQIFDEVAAELNVWDNTRHYYFVCSK